MPVIIKFILFQLVIIIPFIAGMAMKKLLTDPSAASKRILMVNLIALEPPLIIWTIWGLEMSRDLAFLPAAGLLMVVTGLAAGAVTARPLGLAGGSRKSYVISSSLSNHGFTMGGFICYVFLKEPGLGLTLIFIAYFVPYTFLVIFSYARAGSGMSSGSPIREFFSSYKNMPLYAAVVGFILLAAGLPRPAVRFPVDPLIMTSVAIYYWTLGVTIDAKGIAPLRREHLLMAAIKFVMIPLLTFAALAVAPLGGTVRSVILIQSFMPVGLYAVVTSVLFDLDSRLASSLFLVNTMIFIVIVVPVMVMLHRAGVW